MEKNINSNHTNIFKITMSFIIATAIFIFAIGEVNAQSCPFSQQADRTIINFPDSGPIVSNESLDKAIRIVQLGYTSTESVIANISLYGYDTYPARVDVSQPNERYVIVFRSGDTILATSNSTTDLADNVEFAEVNQVVNYNLTIPAGVDNVVALHGVYPDTGSPNSIHPICAAIDIISSVPSVPATCAISFSQNSITAPGEVNLSWSSANADTLMGSCTGPKPSASNSYELNRENFSMSFSASETGTETCTAIPSKNGVEGEPCSASVIVNASTPPPPPPPPTLTASCSASPASVAIGGTISWNATVSGGNSTYTYSWSGTDSLSGTTQNVSKTYSSAGAKTATLTVTSGTDTATANCSATVTSSPSSLTASCSASPSSVAIGSPISWSATATGGNGTYSYSWSGTDSLSGSNSSISKTYSSAGSKSATITVTSGADTATANCNATVTGGGGGPVVCTSNCGGGGGGGGPAIYSNNSLSGYCEGVPSEGKVGDQIIWSAYPSGGNGSYNFNWNGSDGATGYGYSILKTYSTPGAKTMTVSINSGGESISRTCSISIGQVLAYTSPSLTSVYLSEVPYTGLGDIDNLWFFVLALSLWSAGVAYFLQKRKVKLQTQNISEVEGASIKEEIKPTIISQNEIYNKAICDVENCARVNNAIISSEAVKNIAKDCLLNNKRIDLATIESISNVRKTKNISLGEWIAIGEKDL